MIFRRLIASLATAGLLGSAAQAECRQALALGMDVSGSVNPDEYWLQRNGLASALLDPDVMDAFFALPGTPVYLMVFEWSGLNYQKRLTDWAAITRPSDLVEIAGVLRTEPRRRGENATGIGAATLYAARAFREVPECWQKTLDLSGDGKNNDGPGPEMLTDESVLADVTINGLVIGADPVSDADQRRSLISELVAYYQVNVIRGPGAFTEIAVGFSDFQEAMKRKLLREVSVPAFSQLSKSSR